MIMKKDIKRNIAQIIAITDKNIKINTRYKFNLLISYITPIIGILMPLILMGQIFNLQDNVGLWTQNNFIIYQFIAYNIALLRKMISETPKIFHQEKYWQTLPALIIAPFNRINLLFGIFISNLILISIPFIILQF